MKKYILVFSVVLLLAPFLVSAQAILPNAGLTPESSFYFLDRLGEALQQFFTFNPEAKAHLQITFAAERVAEIKIILETKGIDARGLEVAQSRLKAHFANAATIVTDQKSEGKDVKALAKELDDEFSGPKSALKETFKAEKRALEVKEKELKAKIRDARQAGDTAQVEALLKELGEVKAQKELLELKEDEQEEALEREEERLEEEMDAKEEAEKKIRKAEKEKQELLAEAVKEGVIIPVEAFNAFNDHIAEAKSAFKAGKFEEAKHHAEEAKESLDKVEDAIDNLEKAKEEEEELKEEQEEKEREAIEKQDEKVRKDAKKEAEAPKTWTVEYNENIFIPKELKIKKGDTVIWVNNHSEPVWPASAFHPTHQVYRSFDAFKGIKTGESFSFTFDKVGNWKYHNHLNPSVTGAIIVEE